MEVVVKMRYIEFVSLYEKLGATTKRLEKATILSGFLKKLKEEGKEEWIYLLMGRTLPDYDTRESGISTQLVIKIISSVYGISYEKIFTKMNKIGDLGEVIQEFAQKNKQSLLFSSKLEVGKVFENFRKLIECEGKGAVDRKIGYVSELLSNSTPLEAKYIVRTLLSDLRIGISSSTIISAFGEAFGIEPEKIQEAYDLSNDFALIFHACVNNNL